MGSSRVVDLDSVIVPRDSIGICVVKDINYSHVQSTSKFWFRALQNESKKVKANKMKVKTNRFMKAKSSSGIVPSPVLLSACPFSLRVVHFTPLVLSLFYRRVPFHRPPSDMSKSESLAQKSIGSSSSSWNANTFRLRGMGIGPTV